MQGMTNPALEDPAYEYLRDDGGSKQWAARIGLKGHSGRGRAELIEMTSNFSP
jgi:hypothetical protein